jgi:hypothetical protein
LAGLGSVLVYMARGFTYRDPVLTWIFATGLAFAGAAFLSCLILLGRAYLLSEQTASAIEHLEWVADRGESLLDAPLVLPPAFYYLGRAFQLRGDGENAARREYLHYRSRGDASPERAAEARSYLQSPERSESDPD